MPRVISMLRYIASRSSRSSPASRISCRLLTGSASRAMAMTRETLTTAVGGTARAGRPAPPPRSVESAHLAPARRQGEEHHQLHPDDDERPERVARVAQHPELGEQVQ